MLCSPHRNEIKQCESQSYITLYSVCCLDIITLAMLVTELQYIAPFVHLNITYYSATGYTAIQHST